MDSVWITASLTVLVSTMHGVVQLIRHHMRKKVELARITERGRTERVRRVAQFASLEETVKGHSLRVTPFVSPDTGGVDHGGRSEH